MKERKTLLLMFIAALIIRLIYILVFYNKSFLQQFDNGQYLDFAEEIINKGLFSPNFNPQNDGFSMLGPGYPLIIAFSLSIFGFNFIPIFIINCIFTSLTVLVLYYLAKEITANKSLAYFLALWAVFNIPYIFFTNSLMKESIVFLLFPASLLFIIRESKNNTRVTLNILYAILSFIYLIHTDERYFTYLLFLIIPFVLNLRQTKGLYARKILIFLCGVFIFMLPWLIRNYKMYNQVVILTERTTKLTSGLYGKDLTIRYHGITKHPITITNYKSVVDSIKKGLINPISSGVEISNIKQGLDNGLEPYPFSKYEKYLRATINFWRPTYSSPTLICNGFYYVHYSTKFMLTNIIFYGLFLPFYFMGLIYLLVKRQNKFLLFIALLPFVQMMIHVPLLATIARYRNPIDFIVVFVASWFIVTLVNKVPILNRIYNFSKQKIKKIGLHLQ